LRRPDESAAMAGRTWKGISLDRMERIRDILTRRGGVMDKELKGAHELWRIRIEKTVFTAYTSGSLYCNGAHLPELPFLYESISEIVGGE